MTDLPRLALSVRQPWAWAIVHAGKPAENRSWRAPNPGLKFRGPDADAFHRARRYVAENAEELRGKNLACWCRPGAPCHADVLLEVANRQPLEDGT